MRRSMAGDGEFQAAGAVSSCCARPVRAAWDESTSPARATGRNRQAVRAQANARRAPFARTGRAFPARGQHRAAAFARRNRADRRRRGDRRRAVAVAGARTRRRRPVAGDAPRHRGRARAARDRGPRGLRNRARPRLCARVRRSRNRPSRRHARQRHAGVFGRGEAGRFRNRAIERGRDADQHRAHRRTADVHGPRGVGRRAGGPPRRHLFAGCRAVAAADGAALRGRARERRESRAGSVRAQPGGSGGAWMPSSRARWRTIRASVFRTAGELQEALRPFLPTDFLPEPALAELLARHFDVARERRMLAGEVERARRFLASAPEPESPASTIAAEPCRPQRRRRPRVPSEPRQRSRPTGAARRSSPRSARWACARSRSSPVCGSLRPGPSPRRSSRPPATRITMWSIASRHRRLPSPRLRRARPAADDDDVRAPTRRPPARAHQIAASAGRARPPGAKTARPATVAAGRRAAATRPGEVRRGRNRGRAGAGAPGRAAPAPAHPLTSSWAR